MRTTTTTTTTSATKVKMRDDTMTVDDDVKTTVSLPSKVTASVIKKT